MSHTNRHVRFLNRIEEIELDGFLLTHPPNLYYLFGFTGSSAIAAQLGGDCFFIVDSRYLEQARDQVRNATVILSEGALEVALERILRRHSKLRLGFESEHLSHSSFASLSALNGDHVLIPQQALVEGLRALKEQPEIEVLEEAFRRTQDAFQKASPHFTPGLREIQLAGELEYQMRCYGGSGTAFDTIVASGPRSALPHGLATSSRVGPDDWILVDFGIRYLQYCSDLTRVVFLDRKKRPDIFEVVREAQQAALQLVRPGVPAQKVDAASREVISRHGYGDFFGHGTGHGLGLEVHELPRISPRSTETLQEGMVITIEPGIYLPGRFGIRLEDAALVTSSGYRLLSDPDR